VTLAILVAVALAGGLVSTLLVVRAPRAAGWLGLAAAAACFVAALLLPRSETIVVGGSSLTASELVQAVAVAWAGGTALLTCLGLAGGMVAIAGPALLALGSGVLALASSDPGVGFAALGAGAVAAVLLPGLARWLADHDDVTLLPIATRAVIATTGAAIAGLALVAWGASQVGPLGMVRGAGIEDPGARAAVGLGVLAMAATVVVRSGAIPAHLWAARLLGAASSLAIPATLGWGAAAFALAALGWTQLAISASGVTVDNLDRALIGLVAVTSIGLGGLAAILHDDLEHVLGYSIVQGAGVTLLAFTAQQPEGAAAARDWIVASAALTTGLAGWVAAVRWAFGRHRVTELRGWARRAPLLTVAYLVLFAGSIGLPGMALFDARVTLVDGWLPGLLGTALIVVALSPIVALGRVLMTGLGRPSADLMSVPSDRLWVVRLEGGGWSHGGARWILRTARSAAVANVGLGVGVASILLGLLGLGLAVVGVGSATAAG
jgi:NADH:ubiquinone oxidoreductase subunit 2 (subunit N)